MDADPGSATGGRAARQQSAGLKATLALAAGLLAGGGAFGLPSLYVPGIALAVLAAGAATWVLLAARGLRIERSSGPATAVEGEPYPLRIHLRGGILPPRGELVDPLLEQPVAISVVGRAGVRVGIARAGVSLREEARFRRRGRQRLEPPRMVIADPLGLCSRQVEGLGNGEVLVLPSVEPVQSADAASAEDGETAAGAGDGAGKKLGLGAGAEVDGLRPYRKGSPASRIHWRAVARHGDLIERRLVSADGGAALVVLDAERPVDADALDRAARAAASLCVHLARVGGCTLLVAGSTRPFRIDPQLRGWAQAHARLALVEPGAGVGSGFRSVGGGGTFWVTAGGAATVPRGMPPGSFVVTPFPGGGRAAFAVAGCHAFRLEAGRGARRAA